LRESCCRSRAAGHKEKDPTKDQIPSYRRELAGAGESWRGANAVALKSSCTQAESSHTYSYFGTDITVMLDRVRPRLPEEWADAPILVSATHNHHGPDTAFSINDDWFSMMTDEIVAAAEDAVASMQPATMSSAVGDHGYGTNDVRDPVIRNTRLNALAIAGLHMLQRKT
jgi:hypothetical protein